MKMPRTGDRVRFSPIFLASIAAPQWKTRRGTIVAVYSAVRLNGPLYLKIQWDHAAEPTGALSCNVKII